jgi:hypothetical protein
MPSIQSLSLGLSTLTLLLSISAPAAFLNCQIKMNQSTVLSKRIETRLQQKIQLPTARGISSFVTEKPGDVFVAEMFIADYEMRTYAQGSLKTSADQLINSVWGRDMMVDLKCTLEKKSRN